jgi:hypothetical protein
MKICSNCNENKHTDQFQKRAASIDGLTASCKSCLKIRDKIRYPKEKINRSEKHKAYICTEAGKTSRKESTNKYRSENPKKYKAHNAVNNAIRDNKLVKQPCEICGSEDSNGHHDDYDKPLDVRWLCEEHHKQWHDINGEGINGV